MARKGAPDFHAVFYDRRRRKCDQGHEGRIGKVTRLCGACLEEHWAKGGWEPLPPSSFGPKPEPPRPPRDGLHVLVCGPRTWNQKLPIWEELSSRNVALVIHGAAPGADTLAGEVALELGIPFQEWPAEWDRYRPDDPTKKNPAGMIRNRKMLKESQPDLVLAFGDGAGTSDMVRLAEEAGVPVVRRGHEKAPAPSPDTGALSWL